MYALTSHINLCVLTCHINLCVLTSHIHLCASAGHDHINFDMVGTNSNGNSVGSKGCNGNLYRGVATEESDSSGRENSWTKLTTGCGNKDEMMLVYQEGLEGSKVQGRRLPDVPVRCSPPVIGTIGLFNLHFSAAKYAFPKHFISSYISYASQANALK